MLAWPLLPLTLGGLALLALGVALYWVFVITEGTYVGPRLVTWLYDKGAATYDAVKEFDAGDEAYFFGQPLTKRLSRVRYPLVLDVATGTARLPLALLHYLDFDGHVVGLDRSREMLRQARLKTAAYTGRVSLVRDDATSLPFEDGAFDAATCVEALEFMPHPAATLREMVRVLRPGGTLVVTNRRGRDHWFFPGRAPDRATFEARLSALGLAEVETWTWQEYYDLVWARKSPHPLAPSPEAETHASGEGERGPRPLTRSPEAETHASGGEGVRSRRALLDVLRCPDCGAGPLRERPGALGCEACGAAYPWQDGILDLARSERRRRDGGE